MIIISFMLSGMKKDFSKEEFRIIIKESNDKYSELLEENKDSPKALKKHTDLTIFPAIAIYETLVRHGLAKEKAVDKISDVFYHLCKNGYKAFSLWLHLFGNYHRYPRNFVNNSLRDFSKDAGFTYQMKEQNNPAIARFDIITCPYFKMCQKYSCTELTRAFCNSDDAKYSNLHPNLKWTRTGTIGKGATCCDFRIVDVTRYKENTPQKTGL